MQGEAVSAVLFDTAYEFDGRKWLETGVSGVDEYLALPKVVRVEGVLYGKSGWNSDTNRVFYKTGMIIGQ